MPTHCFSRRISFSRSIISAHWLGVQRAERNLVGHGANLLQRHEIPFVLLTSPLDQHSVDRRTNNSWSMGTDAARHKIINRCKNRDLPHESALFPPEAVASVRKGATSHIAGWRPKLLQTHRLRECAPLRSWAVWKNCRGLRCPAKSRAGREPLQVVTDGVASWRLRHVCVRMFA